MTDPILTKLAEIEKRAEAATRGPWADEDSDCIITTMEQGNPNNPFPVVACTSHLCLGEERNPADQDFIAHARTDIPLLCEALREAIEQLSLIAGPVEFYCAVGERGKQAVAKAALAAIKGRLGKETK